MEIRDIFYANFQLRHSLA